MRQLLAGERPERRDRSGSIFPPISRAFARKNRECARAIQQDNGAKFQDAFARGLAVTGFARNAEGGIYLLEPWNEN